MTELHLAWILGGTVTLALAAGLFGGRRRITPRLTVSLAATAALAHLGLLIWLSLESEPSAWLQGWLLGREHPDALLVGFRYDALAKPGAWVAWAIALIGGVMLARIRRPSPRSLAVGMAGALALAAGGIMAWTGGSLFTWLAAISVVSAGEAALLLAAAEGAVATRLLWERAFSLLAGAAGVSILLATHPTEGERLTAFDGGVSMAAMASLGSYDVLGLGLLVFCALAPIKVFPWHGVLGRVRTPAGRWTLSYSTIAAGWASVALLARVFPALRSAEMIEGMALAAGAAALISAVTGVLAHQAEGDALPYWIASSLALIFALADPVGGLLPAFLFAIGQVAVSLGMVILSEVGGTVARPALRMGFMALAQGLPLGAASAGIGAWWSMHSGRPDWAWILIPAWAATSLLAFLVAWPSARAGSASPAAASPRLSALASGLLLTLGAASLAWPWTGRPLGGLLGAVEPSFWGAVFSAGDLHSRGDVDSIAGGVIVESGIALAAAIVLAGVAGFLSARRRAARPDSGRARITAFWVLGFGVDPALRSLRRGAQRLGVYYQERWQRDLVEERLPRLVARATDLLAGAAARAQSGAVNAAERAVLAGVEPPAKLVQLAQSGNLQWYLMIGIGSVIAVLLHFLT